MTAHEHHFLDWSERWGAWSARGQWQVEQLDDLARALAASLAGLRLRADPPSTQAGDALLAVIGSDWEAEIDAEPNPAAPSGATFRVNGAASLDIGDYVRFDSMSDVVDYLKHA